MRGEPSLPPAPILAAFRESADYERIQVTRRRGVVNLAWGLIFLGWIVASLHTLGPKPWERESNSPYWIRVWVVSAIIGFALMGIGAFLIVIARRRKWKGIFEQRPTNIRILDWLATGDLRKPSTWLGILVIAACILGALFLYFVFEGPFRGVFRGLMGMMIVAGAMGFYVTGRSTGDRPLTVLGLAFLIGSLVFFFVDLPDPSQFQLVAGLYFAPPLVLIGAYRLLAPARWMTR